MAASSLRLSTLVRSRLISRVAAISLFSVALACKPGTTGQSASTQPAGERVVLCTFVPMYVFTSNVVGDAANIRIELIAPAALGCPHDYDPRPSDVRRFSTADLIISHGDIDSFCEKLVAATGRNIPIVRAAQECAALPSATADTHDHAAGDDHDHEGHDHAEHDEPTASVNPHAWVSPIEAAKQVGVIERALAATFPEHAEAFARNAQAYQVKLAALADEMRSAGAAFQHRNVVAAHDVFDYLARDLGLNVIGYITQYARGEPSAMGMAELTQRMRESGAAAILIEPFAARAPADALSRETGGTPVILLDPLASYSGTPDAEAYERVQRENLDKLKKALGGAERSTH